MNDFLEKYNKDKRFQTKCKLIISTIFVLIVSIYVISNNNNQANVEKPDVLENNQTENNSENSNQLLNEITLPDNYSYQIDILINNDKYSYYGTNSSEETIVNKEINNTVTTYTLKDGNYYLSEDTKTILTTKDNVFDIVNYDYLDIDNINKYLKISTKENDEYHAYLKDIILGNNTDDYLTIIVKDDNINIDYTPLIKYFNNEINQYTITINIVKN